MRTVSGNIEGVEVLIEAIEENVEVIGDVQTGRKTKLTGIDDRIVEAYATARDTVTAIAKDMGQQFDQLCAASSPKQIELEFSMGFSASTGIWVINAKGESALKVKITWSVGERNHQTA